MKLVNNLKALTIARTPPEVDTAGDFWYPATSSTWSTGRETITDSYESYVGQAYKANAIVFACVLARQMPFSEVRFLYQEMPDGNPGSLHTGTGLDLLRNPGPLLTRMEQDASIAGNFYATPVAGGRRLRRLRADWVSIVSGIVDDPTASAYELEADLLGYIYHAPGTRPAWITPERMVHYAPIPDPDAQWKGMSWMTPVINEIVADSAMTRHKIQFLRRGASLNFAISYDKSVTATQVRNYAALFKEQHTGLDNAYAALHIGGGADPKPLSIGLKDLDYKLVQGAGETRIAAAAGVGPIMAMLSEGLAGSALNAGNYEAAKRKFADITLRPNWRMAATALEKITTPPDEQRLWYDTRDVEFLKTDRKEGAEIQAQRATNISTLVTIGFTWETAVEAVESDDFRRLQHSGLYSVQLQPLGTPAADGIDLTTEAGKRAAFEFITKIGARNSSSDQTLIQTAHDAIVAAGAACTTEEAAA